MTGARSRKSGDDSRCPACSAPIHRELVGHRAALNVTADLTPLTPAEQLTARDPNRLIWCLKSSPHTTPRLHWTGRWHPPDCPHPHVTEHRCNPNRQPTTLF